MGNNPVYYLYNRVVILALVPLRYYLNFTLEIYNLLYN